MKILLNEYVNIFGWIFCLVLTFGLAVPVLVWIISKVSGEINLWKEIRRKNTAAALVLTAVILGICILVGLLC
jgi:uncharacterized membrane protein YjfL (UPF0719 family)